MKRVNHRKGYDTARREEYPGWQDFADAFYWERRGDPKLMEAWLKRIDAVKAKFPKDKR